MGTHNNISLTTIGLMIGHTINWLIGMECYGSSTLASVLLMISLCRALELRKDHSILLYVLI